jgi:DNA primase
VQYLEATLEDIATANRLASEVLGRSLDELPPQTRRLLLLVDEFVRAECERRKLARADFRFSRRDVREFTGWGNTQLKLHLHRLEEMEYVLTHRGKRGQSFVYELLYDGQGKDGRSFVIGLLDVATLADDPKKSGANDDQSALGRAEVGPLSAGGRTDENPTSPNADAALPAAQPPPRKTTRPRKQNPGGAS